MVGLQADRGVLRAGMRAVRRQPSHCSCLYACRAKVLRHGWDGGLSAKRGKSYLGGLRRVGLSVEGGVAVVSARNRSVRRSESKGSGA